VCVHRACVRTALINEISKLMAPEVDLEVLPWSRVERSGRAFGAPGAAHGLGRCNPEPSFGASARPRGIDCAVVQIRAIWGRWLDERTTRPIRRCSLPQAAHP